MMQSDRFGALAGFKVIDLSRVLSGPLCTQILGDHGAEVIKIEPPSGDETREWGPFGAQGSAYYSGINRNKRHAAVDLSKKAGRELLLRLLDGADVLIHNFKAGTLERWELGYDDVLSKRFPRLIYCHITGFGEDGPLEAAHTVDGDPGELCDLLRGGAGTYTCLDVSGAEMALHLDLDLAEAGTVAAYSGAQTLVNRKRVLRAVRSLQHQPCAVVRDGHDTQFRHEDLPGGACRRHVRRCFR